MSNAANPSRESILRALRSVGGDSRLLNEEDKSRILLETVPTAILLDTVPDLWEREYAKHLKLTKLILSGLVACLLGLLVSGVLLSLGRNEPDNARHLRHWSTIVQTLGLCGAGFPAALVAAFGLLSPLHRGLIILLHLRPSWQLTPLLIESLDLPLNSVSKEWNAGARRIRHQTLLIQFLPVWRAKDTSDLTPRQRKILLGVIKQLTRKGTGLYRSIDGPTPPLSEDDADFVLAALNALCRPSRHSNTVFTLDPATRTLLEQLPQSVGVEDVSRQHLQEAAQILLNQGRI